MPVNLGDIQSEESPNFLIQDGKVKILLTYSNTGLFQTCKWKYWVRQTQCLVPKMKELVFSFGHSFHSGVETYYKESTEKLDDNILLKAYETIDGLLLTDKVSDIDNTIPTKVKAMLKGFIHNFANSKYKITDQEIPFLVKLEDAPDFEIDGIPYEFWISGKIDAEMQHKSTGGLYLGEWKTCTSLDDYMYKIRQDNQPWQYILGYFLKNGKRPNGVVYRLAKKTAIRQKKSETIEEFQSRIIQEYHENEAEYYREEVVPFDAKRADRHFNHLYDMAQEMKFAFQNNIWSRSHGSCFNYNKPCPYMSICKTDNESDFNLIASSYFTIKPPNEELIETQEPT